MLKAAVFFAKKTAEYFCKIEGGFAEDVPSYQNAVIYARKTIIF